ncbi:MAG TPA: hypothetical protein VN778_00670, partial [Verrucomicrobiae bacterium]|nr:hypothetical protein [Verrucomicrobiae bacterium]
QGWSSVAPTADTRPGGAVNFNNDTTAPGDPHNGALQLTTDNTTTAKAQYMHNTTTPLSSVTQLSYSTKQNAPVGPIADPSYQLAICATGATTSGCNPQVSPGTGSSFTTLVYEPYQGGQGAIVNNTWQNWNISSGGLFWSTHTVVCSGGTLLGTPGGPASYTLAQVQSTCPDALVSQFGVNIGTNNPGYDVEADLFNFNGTTYNFEPFATATTKDQCKEGGWQNVTDNNGNHFKNQGDCVSYVATNGKNPANG